jgi:transcriptional regulator with XRE-family HTH domain
MSLFFDAAWFDARLLACGLSREGLAERLAIDAVELEALFSNRRQPSAEHLSMLAEILDTDSVEVSLRAGVASRSDDAKFGTSARIERIEARLDAIDQWIEEFERQKRRSA